MWAIREVTRTAPSDARQRGSAGHAPAVEFRLAAGIHLVARLPDHLDELTVVAAARKRSVGLYPMSRYRADGLSRPPQLALGFGALSEAATKRGISAISDLLDR